MIAEGYIRTLAGDPECLAALAWLAGRVDSYPPGRFVPPLKGTQKVEAPRKWIAATLRIGRVSRLKSGERVTRVDWTDGERSQATDGDSVQIATALASRVFTSKLAGYYIVTTGIKRKVLDIFLETIGPDLLRLGYTLQPCITSGGVSFITIRNGKRSWHVVYYETAFGIPLSIGEDRAPVADSSEAGSSTLLTRLYSAISVASDFLLMTFGVAFRLTCGMTAMVCARRHLPAELEKWRPTPLLVAMERIGMGYRGGMTYATIHHGPAYRIDVNRQYTHALRSELPLKVAFGRYKNAEETPHGVYVCRLHLAYPIPYPVGFWTGADTGFVYGTMDNGTYVCVLHTSEFPGLQAHGATILPEWGYTYTDTFTLAGYVECLQNAMDRYGRDSPQGAICKPLGNQIYGKFAQKASRMELLFSEDNPGKAWYPFFDSEGKGWDNIWERRTSKHGASQHVDIAGAITGSARSQTAQMWAYMSALGYRVVRCHTDSLTVTTDPRDILALSSEDIGSWRLESIDDNAMIVGANAFSDGDGVHIAGVSEPTYEMLERMADGHVMYVSQNENLPRQGWTRETKLREKMYRATGK